MSGSGNGDGYERGSPQSRPSPDRERAVNPASQWNIRDGLRAGGYDPDDLDDMLLWGRHQRLNRERIEATERRRRRIAAIAWGAASSVIAIVLSNIIPWLAEMLKRLAGNGGGASGH